MSIDLRMALCSWTALMRTWVRAALRPWVAIAARHFADELLLASNPIEFAIATKAFVAGSGRDKGRVRTLRTVRVQWEGGRMVEVPGSERDWKADLVLLAMGFTHPAPTVLDAFGVERDVRGNARAGTDDESGYATNVPKVFAAGDMRRGQSLVVWAIREGRQAARSVDEFLMGETTLPR